MQRSLTTVALVLSIATATAQASCGKEIDVSQSGKESTYSCAAWNHMVSELPSNGKETLHREGIVSGRGGFILSEALVSDCELRYEMGVYLLRVIGGRNDNEHDKKFAADHSKEIVAVLHRIWPSLSGAQSWAVDGAAHEKYSLLREPGLQAAHIFPLISELLDKEGMNIELVSVMFSRQGPELKVALSRQLTIAEGKGDVPQQIYGLVLLHRLGEPTALPKLRKLSENKNLSNFERTLIPALLAKIRRGEELKFADIENLEYENDRNLTLKRKGTAKSSLKKNAMLKRAWITSLSDTIHRHKEGSLRLMSSKVDLMSFTFSVLGMRLNKLYHMLKSPTRNP